MPHSPKYESREGSANDFEAWHFAGARTEARALFGLLGRNGHTKESLLELIRVSPQEQAALKDCAARYPDLAGRIERALEYRERVEKEFERLCREDRENCVVAQAEAVLPDSLTDAGCHGTPTHRASPWQPLPPWNLARCQGLKLHGHRGQFIPPGD
jgi:hypothetical protein